MFCRYIISILSLLLCSSITAFADYTVMVNTFFPELQNNLTQVTWAHAVNSRAKLTDALNDDSILMIETDILLGQLEGSPSGANPIPITAHPPSTTSDLSLEEFLNTVLTSQKRKGVKLDFKSKEAFAGSENILEEVLVKPEAEFPIWMNADILSGPVNSPVTPVDADYFVGTVVKKFPSAMLSVGWTTLLYPGQTGKYTAEDVTNMTEVLSRNRVITPVTFPVRAAFAANSHSVLRGLISSSVPGTTLTIWMSTDTDKVDLEALKTLILDLGRDKVYLDLPPHIQNQLNLNSSSTIPRLHAATAALLLVTSLFSVFSL